MISLKTFEFCTVGVVVAPFVVMACKKFVGQTIIIQRSPPTDKLEFSNEESDSIRAFSWQKSSL